MLEADQAVRLGGRALDILTVLLEQPGELVTKDELITKVWPNTVVEEGTLRVHMAALRRTLGDGQGSIRYIVNVPGRGYRFVAPVSHEASGAPSELDAPIAPVSNDLPLSLSRVVGRAETIEALVARLPQQRLITIAGPGGIGKTTVAVAVAQAVQSQYPDGVRLIELASLTDPNLVPTAVAAAVGFSIRSENPVPGLIAYLADKKMLIILDSCEHVIGAVADVAAALMNGTSALHLLATSREPLRIQGERVHRLASLEVPPVSAGLTAAEALAYPAVQLFVERAVASQDNFELSDDDAPVVADICRRLDGMALALELAAGRADVLGVRGIASRLDDQFQLLTRGRRTALPRHRTLGAALDWSFDLLPETERAVLRRLSIFAGGFSLEAASAVALDADIPASDVIDCVATLVSKSLVSADVGGSAVIYRLLNTTRGYAREKLAEAGEMQSISRRHAEYWTNWYTGILPAWEGAPAPTWLEERRGEIDNIRCALDWAFSPEGDASLGVSLVIGAVPLWVFLSLVNECRKRVEQALANRGDTADPRRDMQLYAALGSSLMYTTMGPAAHEAWTRALAIADDLGDTGYELRALWGLWVERFNAGAFRESLAVARRFLETSRKSAEPMDALMGERIVGVSLHFLGEQPQARMHIERMLKGYVAPANDSHIVRFHFDQQITARCFQARILWLQGYPDEAMRIVEAIVNEAHSIDHALSLCNALGQGACIIAFFRGDFASAERFAGMLRRESGRHALTLWNTWARTFEGVLVGTLGNIADGLVRIDAALNEFPETKTLPRYLGLFGQLARLLGVNGDVARGLEVIDWALAQAEQNEERWGYPELLRIKGRLLLRENAAGATTKAEGYFMQALDWAGRQEALSWELRTTLSLTRLRRSEGRREEALALLVPIYARFTEGFGTADLMTAKRFIDELS